MSRVDEAHQPIITIPHKCKGRNEKGGCEIIGVYGDKRQSPLREYGLLFHAFKGRLVITLEVLGLIVGDAFLVLREMLEQELLFLSYNNSKEPSTQSPQKIPLNRVGFTKVSTTTGRT